MAVYSYKARDSKGNLIAGMLEGESQKDVVLQLRRKEYTPVKVIAGEDPELKKAQEKVPAKSEAALDFFVVQKVSVRDMMALCINLSSMASAGIPLLGSLEVISKQLSNVYFSETVRDVARLISEGMSFAEALNKHPKVFSSFFVNMVRVGEASGTLDETLRSMAVYMEQQEVQNQKISGAMTYPILLIVAGTGVILVIMTFVLPKFVEIFMKAGVELPLATRILYHSGIWLSKFWFLPPAVFGGLAYFFNKVRATPRGADLWGRFVLNVPIFGTLIRDVLVARFSRTLGSLLMSGVALLQSLDILKEVVDNSVFVRITAEVRESAEKGEGVYRAMAKRREFPQDAVYMVSVGEQSGKIGQMLLKVADFYENRADYKIRALLTYIEPVFILFLAVAVGTMLAAVILPMFDMIKTLNRS